MGCSRARLVKETEGAELTVLVDLNADLAREVGGEMECEWTANLDDALGRSDVDAVLVMTPSGLHAKIGVEVARAGKHVITTKPMDVSTANCDALIGAAEEAGVILGVDYQSRYVDNNYRVAEALRLGWLGKPILGEARFKWYSVSGVLRARGRVARHVGDGRRGIPGQSGFAPYRPASLVYGRSGSRLRGNRNHEPPDRNGGYRPRHT